MIFYPSGNLHLGHIRTYSFINFVVRYHKQILKQDIIFPIGGDCFGLPTSNAAKEMGIEPRSVSDQYFNQFVEDLKKYNFDFDWNYCIRTDSKEYINWIQSKIIKLYKNNYIYGGKSIVNYDPVDKEYLSNEQCPNGIGWRSGAKIEYRLENAIFINIKKIEEDLYNDTFHLTEWCQTTLKMQRKWINLKEMKYCFNNDRFLIPQVEKIYLNKELDLDLPSIDFRSDKLYKILGEEKIQKILNINKYPYLVNENNLNFYITNGQNHSIYNFEFNDIQEELYTLKENVCSLRNWCISRNRTWGCPLPESIKKDFNIDATMDTFVDSSIYFLYYQTIACNEYGKSIKFYAGGIEHACMHLIYARSMQKLLKKCKENISREPFLCFKSLGMVLHKSYYHKKECKYILPDDVGKYKNEDIMVESPTKMSKSKKNYISAKTIVNSDFKPEVIKTYLLSNQSYKDDFEFNIKQIKGIQKFYLKIYNFKPEMVKEDRKDPLIEKVINKMYENLEKYKFNLVIANLNSFFKMHNKITKKQYTRISNILRLFKDENHSNK